MNILLNPKLWIAGALVGLLLFAGNQLNEYGENKYQAGYDARVSEETQAASDLQKELDKLKLSDSEKADEIEKLLQKNQKLSDELSLEIGNAELVCDDLGSEFLRLFNQGSRAKSTGSVEAR
jgi:hypothetical protein